MTPERIGKYEIRGELGRGGFGQVLLGFDPTVGRQVAIKVLSAKGDPSSLPRFRKEATASGNLHHKNIVTIHEFGEDHGTFYIVMEYLEGHDLQHIISTASSLSLLERMRIMSQAAEGLQCAHQHGIIHRDVKPANIMVLDDGTVKVMDFGIARLTGDRSTRLTETGFLIGSVFYMAPEQLAGQEVDARCDIWAFGAIYYELLCGHHPFEAPDAASGMFHIMQREPAAIQSVCPQCPNALAAVLTRLLSKDRDSRYQSFEEVLFDTAPILLDLESRQANQFASEAHELMRSGHLDQAQAVVKRILTIDPAHQQGRTLWREIQAGLRQRSAQMRAQALIEQAQKAVAGRDFATAIEAVESAVRVIPSDLSLQARLTELRAAKQRADMAAKLVETARESLQANNLSAAFRLLSEALSTEPGNSEAQRLLSDVQVRISERDADRRIHEGLTKVNELLTLRSFDEAIGLLEDLSRQAPVSEPIRATLELARQQRQEYYRHRSLQSELDAAKNEIKSNQFEAAIARLEPLATESVVQNDAAGLLAYARRELEAAQRLAKIKAAGAEAWRLFKAQEFDRALTQVETALLTFPDDSTLLRLRQAIVKARAEQERARFLQQAFNESAELERNGRDEQACATLERAIDRYPAEPSLTDALTRIRQKRTRRQEQERVATLEGDLKQAEALISQGQTVQAAQLLSRLKAACPSEVRLHSLLDRLRTEEQRRGALGALLAEAQRYLDAGEPDQACEVVARGRREFGLDAKLIALEVTAEKMHARKEAFDRARTALHERNWHLAAATLETVLQHNAHDGEARRLLDQVLEQERADLRRNRRDMGLMEAEKLIQAQRFDEAVRHLRALHDEFPDDTAVGNDLRRALQEVDRQARREAYAQGRDRVAGLLKAGQFKAAIETIETLVAEFPDDAILKEDLKGAGEAAREHDRRERYATERSRATELMRARKLDEAIALLKALLSGFPGDSTLEEDLKSAIGARELQEKRERLDREVAQLEKFYRKGDASAVRGKASALPPDLQDARVRELLDWATGEIERSGQEKKREAADSLRHRRSRRITVGAVVAVCVASAAVLIPVALRQRPAPERLPAPAIVASEDGAAKARTNEKAIVSLPKAQSGASSLHQPIKAAVPAPTQGKAATIPAPTPKGPLPTVITPQSAGEPAVTQRKVHSASLPLPAVTDCGPTYHLPRAGYLRWASVGAPLPSGGVLVLGGPDENLAGGQKQGAGLPGCEVGLAPKTAGITIEEPPSRADGFRRVKLRNASNVPISSIELKWEIK
ncbi:MAG: protein kinase [Bryobacteraceae bacterium]